MYRCKSWTIKKAEHFRTVVLEKTLESLLDCKETKPVNPKENQPWTFIGRSEADAKNWLIQKDPDAGKDWGWKEREATEDGVVGWHHWLNGYEFEQTLGDTEGQGSLVYCLQSILSAESDTT